MFEYFGWALAARMARMGMHETEFGCTLLSNQGSMLISLEFLNNHTYNLLVFLFSRVCTAGCQVIVPMAAVIVPI